MTETSFRFASDGSVFTDDASLLQPLANVLGRVLRVDRVPPRFPLVGHCPVAGRWCVFAREPGESGVRGVVLAQEAYAEVGFDPFVAGAAHLRFATLVDAVRRGPVEPSEPPQPLDELAEPLRTAYGCFLAGDPELRKGPYVSTLPAGLATEISPLTCLTVAAHEEPPPADEVFPGPGGDRPATADGDEGSWHDLQLERGGDAVAGRPAPPPPRPPAGDVERRIEALERSLTRTRWVLGGGLAVALLAGVAGGFTLASRLTQVERTSLTTATVARGLGITAGAEAEPDAIAAHLHDLATVAVQSGAWQAGLRRRGVEPARFLDQLVDLGAAHDRLLGLADDAAPLGRLADQSDALLQLAPRAANLLTLAGQEEAVTDLASRRDALDALADRSKPLTALAGAAKSLTELSAAAPDLRSLAAHHDALSSLAREQSALDSLAARATPLRTLADDGADLMVFWERYQTPLRALAERRDSLEALVKRQRTLERLVETGPDLFSLAGSQPLLRLVQQPERLRALTDDLDDLLALADHRDELLGTPRPGRERPAPPRPSPSG